MESLSLKEHYQNQKFNNLHEFFWGFGSAFHTVYAVVPLFLKELGSPEVIASSSAGLFSIIIALPMLIIAALTRNIVNMKRMVISVHCLILLIAFLMGYVFTFSEFGENPDSWKIYFTLFIFYALSIGIIVPIWADFLEKTTKKSLRGTFTEPLKFPELNSDSDLTSIITALSSINCLILFVFWRFLKDLDINITIDIIRISHQ